MSVPSGLLGGLKEKYFQVEILQKSSRHHFRHRNNLSLCSVRAAQTVQHCSIYIISHHSIIRRNKRERKKRGLHLHWHCVSSVQDEPYICCSRAGLHPLLLASAQGHSRTDWLALRMQEQGKRANCPLLFPSNQQ